MKRTTYIMIGAFVAGLVAMIAIFLFVVANTTAAEKSTLKISGRTECVALPGFSYVETKIIDSDSRVLDFSAIDINEDSEEIDLKEMYTKPTVDLGMEIAVSDSISAPQLVVPLELKDYVSFVAESDTLCVTLDFDSFMESQKVGMNQVSIDNEAGYAFSIILPEGKLKGLRNYCFSTTLRGISSPVLDLEVNNVAEMKDCRIDLLNLKSKMRELILCNTSVDRIEMTTLTGNFCLNSCDSTGFVGSLDITGTRSYTVDLRKANVGSVKWSPEKEKYSLKVRTDAPMTLTPAGGR